MEAKLLIPQTWQTYCIWSTTSSLVAGTAISAGHSPYRVGLTRCASTAEKSLRTIERTLVATSRSEKREELCWTA